MLKVAVANSKSFLAQLVTATLPAEKVPGSPEKSQNPSVQQLS